MISITNATRAACHRKFASNVDIGPHPAQPQKLAHETLVHVGDRYHLNFSGSFPYWAKPARGSRENTSMRLPPVTRRMVS